MSTAKTIQNLERQRQKILERLCSTQTLIRGSYSKSYRRCGRANCWCAEGEGHAMNRISFTDNGKSRTKVVSAEDAEWARQMTENFQSFRKDRQALRQLEKKINVAINEFEAKIIKRTAAKKGYKT